MPAGSRSEDRTQKRPMRSQTPIHFNSPARRPHAIGRRTSDQPDRREARGRRRGGRPSGEAASTVVRGCRRRSEDEVVGHSSAARHLQARQLVDSGRRNCTDTTVALHGRHTHTQTDTGHMADGMGSALIAHALINRVSHAATHPPQTNPPQTATNTVARDSNSGPLLLIPGFATEESAIPGS